MKNWARFCVKKFRRPWRKRREWAKVGFYIYFKVNKKIEKIENIDWPLPGPYIKSKNIDQDAGSVFWAKDGFINCVEIFAYGNFINENIVEYLLLDNL